LPEDFQPDIDIHDTISTAKVAPSISLSCQNHVSLRKKNAKSSHPAVKINFSIKVSLNSHNKIIHNIVIPYKSALNLRKGYLL
jgi:hypothetical protein